MFKKLLSRMAVVGAVALGLTTTSAMAATAATPLSAPNATHHESAVVSATPAANAPLGPEDGPLNPLTYQGPMIVPTQSGDVIVDATQGHATTQAREIASDIAMAQTVPPTSSCGDWTNAVAGPDIYWKSAYGPCGVMGYPGYKRPMQWHNASDIWICVQGRGFSGGSAEWYTLGCDSGGSTDGADIPWGNNLAATRAEGFAFSPITTAAYQFR